MAKKEQTLPLKETIFCIYMVFIATLVMAIGTYIIVQKCKDPLRWVYGKDVNTFSDPIVVKNILKSTEAQLKGRKNGK